MSITSKDAAAAGVGGAAGAFAMHKLSKYFRASLVACEAELRELEAKKIPFVADGKENISRLLGRAVIGMAARECERDVSFWKNILKYKWAIGITAGALIALMARTVWNAAQD